MPSIIVKENIEIQNTSKLVTIITYVPSIIVKENIEIQNTSKTIGIDVHAPSITTKENVLILPIPELIDTVNYVPSIEITSNIYIQNTSKTINVIGYPPSIIVTNNIDILSPTNVIYIDKYIPDVSTTQNIDIPIITNIIDIVSYIPAIELINDVNITTSIKIISIVGYTPTMVENVNCLIDTNMHIIDVNTHTPFVISKQNVMSNILSKIVDIESYNADINTSTNIYPNTDIFNIETHVPLIECVRNINIPVNVRNIDIERYQPSLIDRYDINISASSYIIDISGGNVSITTTSKININVSRYDIGIVSHPITIVIHESSITPLDNVYAVAASRSSTTYGNVASTLRETIIAKFPYNFFKYTNISTELAFRNMRRQFGSNTDIEISKRKKPYLVINPSFNLPGSDMFLYETPLTKNFQNIEYGISTGALFPIINDLENRVKFMYKLNRDKIDFEVTLTLSTVHQQIDVYKAMMNIFTWDNPIYTNVSLESVLPKSFVTFFGKLIGVDMDDNDTNNIPILLQKLNSNSQYPITYKMRNASSQDEFYMYYNHKVLTTYSDLSLDKGTRKNMADDNFNITFNVSMEFNLPGLFVIMGAEPRYELDVAFNVTDYGSNYTEFIPIYTFNNLYNDYMSRIDGFRLYTSSIFTTNKDAVGIDTLDITPIFEQNYIDIIKEYLTLGNPLIPLIRLLIIKDRVELKEDRDWSIDWSSMIISITNLDPVSTYRLLVYTNGIKFNERLIEISDNVRNDKSKNIL